MVCGYGFFFHDPNSAMYYSTKSPHSAELVKLRKTGGHIVNVRAATHQFIYRTMLAYYAP